MPNNNENNMTQNTSENQMLQNTPDNTNLQNNQSVVSTENEQTVQSVPTQTVANNEVSVAAPQQLPASPQQPVVVQSVAGVAPQVIQQVAQNANNQPATKEEVQQQSVVSAPPKNKNMEEKVIFNIAEEKESNPLVVIAFFVILIVFVFLLEPINKYVNKFLYPESVETPVNNNQPSEPTKPEEKPEEKIEYYEMNTNIIPFDDFKIYNLTTIKDNYGNNYVSYTLTNDSDKDYKFDKKYYIEFYNEKSDNPISRAMIHSYETVAANSKIDLTMPISTETAENAKRVRIREINPSDYPVNKMLTVEGDYEILTCKHFNTEMKYYFFRDQLTKATENYNAESNISVDNLTTLYNEQNILIEKYKQIGIDAVITRHPDNTFASVTNIDYKTVQPIEISSLNQYRFFSDGKKSKIVAYEMRAMGYTCS